MRKILFIASVASHINAFHIPIIRELKKKGYRVDVAAKIDCDISDYVDNIFDIPFERSPIKLKNLKAYKELKKLRGKYDVIHCHTPMASVISRIIFSNNAKVIYTAHGFHFFKGSPIVNWLVYYPIEKIMSKKTDILITINKEDYERAIQKFYCKDIKLINGVGIDLKKIKNFNTEIDLRKEFNMSENTKILVSVGELNNNKNHKLVIKSLKKLNNRFEYIIVGKGDSLDELIELSKKYGVENRVHFMGYRSDVLAIVKNSDYFIFPSLREGLPVSVLEAVALNIPVIASNIRGNKDIIENTNGGILFESNNSQDLVSCINRIHKKSFNTDDINIDCYGEEAVLKEMEKLYKC